MNLVVYIFTLHVYKIVSSKFFMAVTIAISAILALIAGVIILVWPKALNLAVALWLIAYGVLSLLADVL